MNAQPAVNLRKIREDGKDQLGRFAAGNSGKPKGAVSRDRELIAQLKAMSVDAINGLKDAVSKKEKWALLFVLERHFPTGLGLAFENDLDVDEIATALKDGQISTSEANERLEVIAKIKGITEIGELRARLTELEASSQTQKR